MIVKFNRLPSILLLASTILLFIVSMEAQAQPAPSDYTYAIRYDSVGRVTGTLAPDPDGTGALKFAAVRNTYDAAGRLIKVENGELSTWQSETVAPSNWSTAFTVFSSVETTYDVHGRKFKDVVKGSGGVPVTVTQYSYVVSRLECTAIRMNAAIYSSLPSSACTPGTQGSFGPDRITRNVYDAAGQLTKVQEAYGTALQEDYATYTYSPNGKRTSLTDARGYKASMTYDGFDRQVKWNFPSPTATGTVSTADYEQYTYDANGNRTSFRKRDGSTLTYQYDALNRVTRKTVPERAGLLSTHTRDVYYGYDLRGLQTYARFDSAAATSEGLTMTYDGLGRLTSSALKMDGVTRTLSYAHDQNGNRTELTWPDGLKHSYAYDGLDRMTTLFEGAIGSTKNMVGYSYNDRGLRATQTGRMGQVATFGYDSVGRLNALSHNIGGTTHDVSFSYGYTPASQLASASRDNDVYAWTAHYDVDRNYAANGLNQYTAAGPATFTYDANGNLTSDGSTTFLYDVENRLVSASGAKNMTLRYDPLGRQYETIIGPNTTRILYDGDELVAEYDGSGTLLRRYAHGSGIDDPVLWYRGTGLTIPYWLHADPQGSIIAITEANGNIYAVNSYDEYGIRGTAVGRFQYTGQAWLPELDMYYYKARIYSPTLGRFLQTDPIGYDDQVNLYAYVGSDPVNRTDPTGQEAASCYGSSKCGFSQVSAEDQEIHSEIVWGLANIAAVGVDLIDTPVSPGPDATIVVTAARQAAQRPGFFKRLWSAIVGKNESALPKPPTGRGSVPRSERDPRRSFSPSERAAKRQEQGGRCANSSCGREINETNSEGHHIVRHADGGPTTPENHVELCKDCHRDIHNPH